MNFKEAKKHNKKLWDLYLKDEITKEEEEEGQIDLADLVSNQLESDEGLDKFYFILFHLTNANGVRALLPDWQEFKFTDEEGQKKYWHGASLLYSRLDNYHSRKLSEYLGKSNRVTWWAIHYEVAGIKEDVKEYQKWKEEKEAIA
tara:strand:+ start:235 stop:669 length:435 start_codon:yes stop_codon:yes gene_type:complete